MFSSGYEDAVEACYDATADPGRWSSALDQLAWSVGATGAMFYPKDINENAGQVPSSTVYSELLEDYVEGEWFNNHYRAMRGWPLLEAGKSVVIEHDLATDEERRRLPHYNELYLKWKLPAFAAIGFKVDGEPWCLPLLRDEQQGFFTEEEAQRFADLAPHLARMVRLARLFERTKNDVSLEAFDRVGTAAALVRSDGKLLSLNKAAESLLSRNRDVISLHQGLLRARHPGCNTNLERLLAVATAENISAASADLCRPAYIRRHGCSPISVEAVRPPTGMHSVAGSAKAILLFKDAEERQTIDPLVMSDAFNLTRSESALCVQLAQGQSVSAAARALGISDGTARQYLKGVFQKTGTHRQSELMLLLSKLGLS
jgi:DNA-binding CsgD family transcriptional regulator